PAPGPPRPPAARGAAAGVTSRRPAGSPRTRHVEIGHDHARRGTALADRLADGAVLRVELSGVGDVETQDRGTMARHEVHEVGGEDGLGMRRAKDMVLLDPALGE